MGDGVSCRDRGVEISQVLRILDLHLCCLLVPVGDGVVRPETSRLSLEVAAGRRLRFRGSWHGFRTSERGNVT